MPFISGPTIDDTSDNSTNMVSITRDSIYIDSFSTIFGKTAYSYFEVYTNYIGCVVNNHLYINHPDVYGSSNQSNILAMKLYDINLETQEYTVKNHTNICTINTSAYYYNRVSFYKVDGNNILCTAGTSYAGALFWYNVIEDTITIISTDTPVLQMFSYYNISYSCDIFWASNNRTVYMIDDISDPEVITISVYVYSAGSRNGNVKALLIDDYTGTEVLISNDSSLSEYWLLTDTNADGRFTPVYTRDEPAYIPYSTVSSRGDHLLNFHDAYKSVPSIPNCWVIRNQEYSGGDIEYLMQIKSFNTNSKELDMRLTCIPSGWELYRKDKNSPAVCGSVHEYVVNDMSRPECQSFNIIADNPHEWYSFTSDHNRSGLIPFLTKFHLEDE